MNWRRGVFRLWAVLSALWLLPIGAMVGTAYNLPDLLAEPFTWWLLIGPPAAALVLLTALGWALSGFARN